MRSKSLLLFAPALLSLSALIGCGGGGGGDTPKGDYYTVTFNSNGGSAVASAKVAKGATVTKPTNPTKANCDFSYWYTTDENVEYNFSTPVNSDFTLNAKWVAQGAKTFTVTFKMNSVGTTGIEGKEGFTDETYKVEEGKTLGKTFTKPRTNFKGFYVEGDETQTIVTDYDTQPVTNDITYVAYYEYEDEYQPLTLKSNANGSTVKLTVGSEHTSKITLEYKKNSDEWKTLFDDKSGTSDTITLNNDDTVQLRNRTTVWCENGYSETANKAVVINLDSNNGTGFDVSGCIDSLINYVDTLDLNMKFYRTFKESHINTVESDSFVSHYKNKLQSECFKGMFLNSKIIDAKFTMLSTTLNYRCYEGMFQGCYNLKTPPVMYDGTNPIDTSAHTTWSGAFKNMFSLYTGESSGALHVYTTSSSHKPFLRVVQGQLETTATDLSESMLYKQYLDDSQIASGGAINYGTTYYF